MKVRWIAAARQDRRDVLAYIRAGNPGAAARIDQLFSDATARLAEHPKLGKPGKIPGTRGWYRMKAIAWCTRSTVG